LAHAQHVGDGLGRRAVIAALGEHAGGRIDDRVGATQQPAVAQEARAGRVGVHARPQTSATRKDRYSAHAP
jgi:hypothetical protein